MHTKETLLQNLNTWGIPRDATVLIHSSMKAIGEVDGRADTVLDALMEYFAPGLLVMPTHSWNRIGADNPVFDVDEEPSCVGILGELFRHRKGVLRSKHPTHSVAAYGADAQDYVRNEELCVTPCAREGCWGKLYDRDAYIVFLGCTMHSNTFIHGVEEWYNVPLRLQDSPTQLYVREGEKLYSVPQYRHFCPMGEVSQHYIKLRDPMLARGIVHTANFGDALCYIGRARPMADLTGEFLQKNPQLFVNGDPVPKEWYE